MFACRRRWYLWFLITEVHVGQRRAMTTAVTACRPGPASSARRDSDLLASWAQNLGQARQERRGCLRFAFYGRVSTEDWQDPVTSRARQLQ
jgi:hypothetical protein